MSDTQHEATPASEAQSATAEAPEPSHSPVEEFEEEEHTSDRQTGTVKWFSVNKGVTLQPYLDQALL